MSRHGWKAHERLVAKAIGGERVPVTGRARGNAPDVAHDHLSVEIKTRKRLPRLLWDAMDQAVKSAATYHRKHGREQLPVVFLHEDGKTIKNDFVVMRMGDWMDWYGPMSQEEFNELRKQISADGGKAGEGAS